MDGSVDGRRVWTRRLGLTGVSSEKCDNDRGENLTVRELSASARLHSHADITSSRFVIPVPGFVTRTSGSRPSTISGLTRDHALVFEQRLLFHSVALHSFLFTSLRLETRPGRSSSGDRG